MNRDDYIKQCLTEHLLTRIYKKLPNITAMNMINLTKTALTNIFYTHKFQLSQAEITYFTRSFKLCHRIPIFYGMPKVYKNPMALRPVVRLTILNPILHQRLKGPSNRNKKKRHYPRMRNYLQQMLRRCIQTSTQTLGLQPLRTYSTTMTV
jgi:hypothetical protein